MTLREDGLGLDLEGLAGCRGNVSSVKGLRGLRGDLVTDTDRQIRPCTSQQALSDGHLVGEEQGEPLPRAAAPIRPKVPNFQSNIPQNASPSALPAETLQ